MKGDEVVPEGTGYVQAVIAEPEAADAVKVLIARVASHVRRYRPRTIIAYDGCMCPVFFAESAGCVPSTWAWIGQCFLDVGFEVRERHVRLVTELGCRRHKVRPPEKLKLRHVTHGMYGVDAKYDFGCVLLKPPHKYGDGVVWCGNFFSGAFVKGASCRSLYINWFTILDEAYRGKGLGRLVLQHCLYEAQQRGAKFASLLTDVDNLISQNLYRSEGFEIADVMHTFELKGKQKIRR